MKVQTIRHQAKPTVRRFRIIRGEEWETGAQQSGAGLIESEIIAVNEVPASQQSSLGFSPTTVSLAAWLHSLPFGLDEERCDGCGGPVEEAPGGTVLPNGTNPGDVQPN